MHLRLAFLLSLAFGVSAAVAAPKISSGISTNGVIAYQDDRDPTQFHYLPGRVALQLGSTLDAFRVTYWGIGGPYRVQESDGQVQSRVGAVIAGNATFDISADQRLAI